MRATWKKFCKSDEDSELYMGIRSDMIREEVDVVVYSSSSGITRRQWPNRLKVVFHLLVLTGDLDHQARQFVTLYREAGMAVVHRKLTSFISYQI